MRRRLFDAQSDEADSAYILCRLTKDASAFVLEAGTLHGVVLGSEYDIFETDIPGSPEARTSASIVGVGPFKSTLKPSNSFLDSQENQARKVWYARLTRLADTVLDVFCADTEYLQRLLNTTASAGVRDEAFVVSIQAVRDEAKADLVLTIADDQVYFDRGAKSNISGLEGLDVGTRVSGSVQASDDALNHCRHVINAFARFVMHLTRTKVPPGNSEVIKISLKEVQKKGRVKMVGDELFVSDTEPVTVQVDKNLPPKRQPRYGMMIENLTGLKRAGGGGNRLYLHLFAFDFGSLSISMCSFSPMT